MEGSPFGEFGPRHHNAPSDEGDFSGVLDDGDEDLAIAQELFTPDDYDIVSSHVEEFMNDLYGTNRYAHHNDRLLGYYNQYSGAQDEREGENEATVIDKMTIVLHDFVDHAILHPEKTATQLGLVGPDAAEDIRTRAVDTFTLLLDAVDDQDGLVKALSFTIDMSKWEAEARIWRSGATTRIADMVYNGEISADDEQIINAAVHKNPALDDIDAAELKRVLKRPEHLLTDLKLGAISETTLKYNIKGVFFKGWETLDLLKHPPEDNPASTYRDCTEAINFFVPALMGLGFKNLAIDLRDAALQWFYDDPNGDAKQQHEVSQQYFNEVKDTVTTVLKTDFSDIELSVEARVKSEGSLREKLAKDSYKTLHETPDGVGLAFVVPNGITESEMEQFAKDYRERLISEPQVIPGHPNPEEKDFEKMKQASGYEAIHMTFYYYAAPGLEVPFEIQILTEEQHRMKTYGRSSDLFYKGGTEYSPEDQPYLQHLEARAQAERELAPGSTIQSIAEMVVQTPEVPFVYNKLFRAVDIDGVRLLVPPELEKNIRSLSSEVLNEAGSLTVLPPGLVGKAQFLEAISMFDSELAADKNILNALERIQKTEAGHMRTDGKTPVVEGHLLPTALTAVMLAIQSGKIWGKHVGPTEHISNIATIALLHDYVENVLEGIEDPSLKVATRELMFGEIRRDFGQTVIEGVSALTIPFEIEHEFERREQYAENIQANEYARLIKPADRLQNHVSDLIRLTSGEISPSSSDGQAIMRYFAKTDRHLSKAFTSAEMPPPYRRTHNAIWQLAKKTGYDPALYV